MTDELKFVILLFLVGAAAIGKPVDTQAQLADQAEQSLRSGDTQGAIATLEKASAEPGTAPSEDRLGFLYAVAGRQDDAATHFRKAIQADSAYAPAHYHLGALLWLSKDQEHGLPELQSAVRLDPKTFDYRYHLGAAYVDLGDNDQALSELKTAVSLDSTKAEAWQQLGITEQRTNGLVPALAAYAKALEINPKDDAVRNAYSGLLIETRQPERGIQEAQKVLAHNKADTSAQLNVGYAYLKMGEFSKAEKAYRGVLSVAPQSVAAHYDLAIALKMQDQIEAAQKEFTKAIEIEPALPEAHYTLGITNWQLGDLPGTVNEMKAALAIRPEYAEAHYMLGIALKQSGDLDQALMELKESIRLDPTTPGPYNTLGQILRTKGDKQGSQEAFATGAKVKNEKDRELSNSLEQGMRGGIMPKPMGPK